MRAVLSHLRLKALQQRPSGSTPATATRAMSNEAQHCYKFVPLLCTTSIIFTAAVLRLALTALTQQVPASITHCGRSNRSGGGTEAAADKEETPTVPGTLLGAVLLRRTHALATLCPLAWLRAYEGLQWQQDCRRRASGRSQVVLWTKVSRSIMPQHASCRRRHLSTRVTSS